MPAYKRFKTKYKDVFYVKMGTGKKFYIRYYHPITGKRVEEPVGVAPGMTAARANQVKLRRMLGEPSNKDRRDAKKEEEERERARLTVNRIWEIYLEGKSYYRSRYNEESLYNKHVRPNFGDREPSKISPLDVDRVRIRLFKEGKKTTAVHALGLLRRISQFGVKKGLCQGLNFHLEIPKIKNERTNFLNSEQIATLVDSASRDQDGQLKNIILTALYTGLRKSAILRLKWRDVDFNQVVIYLREPKGGKEGEVDTIPLCDQLKTIMRSLKKPGEEHVFPSRIMGRPRKDISESWYRVLARADLEGFRFHDLRHTFASHLASSGQVDMYRLQKLLTHRNPRNTQRYAHLHDTALKEAAGVAGDLISEMLVKVEQRKTSISKINRSRNQYGKSEG